MENQVQVTNFNNEEVGLDETSLKWKIDEFCYLLENTRTTIVDLESTVANFIKESRQRDNGQRIREKMLMDVKNLENVVRRQNEKIGILENQILWLNYVEWGISKSVGIEERTMKEIHEAATYWLKVHQYLNKQNHTEPDNEGSENRYESSSSSSAPSPSSSSTTSTTEDSNMG